MFQQSPQQQSMMTTTMTKTTKFIPDKSKYIDDEAGCDDDDAEREDDEDDAMGYELEREEEEEEDTSEVEQEEDIIPKKKRKKLELSDDDDDDDVDQQQQQQQPPKKSSPKPKRKKTVKPVVQQQQQQQPPEQALKKIAESVLPIQPMTDYMKSIPEDSKILWQFSLVGHEMSEFIHFFQVMAEKSMAVSSTGLVFFVKPSSLVVQCYLHTKICFMKAEFNGTSYFERFQGPEEDEEKEVCLVLHVKPEYFAAQLASVKSSKASAMVIQKELNNDKLVIVGFREDIKVPWMIGQCSLLDSPEEGVQELSLSVDYPVVIQLDKTMFLGVIKNANTTHFTIKIETKEECMKIETATEIGNSQTYCIPLPKDVLKELSDHHLDQYKQTFMTNYFIPVEKVATNLVRIGLPCDESEPLRLTFVLKDSPTTTESNSELTFWLSAIQTD